MITIYADLASGNCHKVLWVARYLHIPHRVVDIDVVAGGARTVEFLAVNPWGKVPAVVLDDGRLLTESNAIIAYLADGSALIPTARYPRARMLQWMFWEQYSHEPAIAVRRYRKHFLGQTEAQLDPALLTSGQAALAEMERALAGGGFLAGDAVSLADVALVAYTRLAHEGGFDLTAFPAVRLWVGRVEAALHIV
jgi:glutathione S-transferase